MCRPAADAHPLSLPLCVVCCRVFFFIYALSLSLFSLSGSIKVTALCSPAPGQKVQRLLVVTLSSEPPQKRSLCVIKTLGVAGGVILNNDSGHLLYRSRSTPLQGACGVRRVSSRDTFSGINTFTSALSRAPSCCFTTLEA